MDIYPHVQERKKGKVMYFPKHNIYRFIFSVGHPSILTIRNEAKTKPDDG